MTANLILNLGPEPVNTPIHQNWIHTRTALIQTRLDGEAQKWFLVLPTTFIKSDWKRFKQKFSTPKETNNIKEFYAIKFVESQTKQLNNQQLELKY